MKRPYEYLMKPGSCFAGKAVNCSKNAIFILYWLVTSYWHKSSMSLLSLFGLDENSRIRNESAIFEPQAEENCAALRICAVGDLIFENSILKCLQQRVYGIASNNLGMDEDTAVAKAYESLFENVKKLISGDIVYGNLETVLGRNLSEETEISSGIPRTKSKPLPPFTVYDSEVYGEKLLPSLNNHPGLALALKEVGFDILSTANNHTWDRLSNGIDETLDHLDKAGIRYCGSIRTADALSSKHRHSFALIEKNGIRAAFLSYTQRQNPFFRNYAPLDPFGQTNRFSRIFPNHSYFEHIDETIRMAREEADIVIVAAHWGMENTHYITPKQLRWSQQLCDAGVDIILGHHPHVLQPCRKYSAKDGRECLIIYSMGNFVAGIPKECHLLSALFYIDVAKTSAGIRINGFSHVPTISRFSGDPSNPQIDIVSVEDLPDKARLNEKAASILGMMPDNQE